MGERSEGCLDSRRGRATHVVADADGRGGTWIVNHCPQNEG
jgi:hypothetical protein